VTSRTGEIVIDEDMHKSVAEPLEKLGYNAIDIRDRGLRGSTDQEVYQFAQQMRAALLSGDKDFSNIARFPLGEHHGIIIARFPTKLPTNVINKEIFQGLKGLSPEKLAGSLVILSPGRTRVRKK